MTFSNNEKYEGYFVKDHFHGKGTYVKSDETSFTGLWRKGKPYGEGVLQMGEFSYHGQFKKGQAHGKGQLKYLGEIIFDGDWLEGKQDGKGCTFISDAYIKFLEEGGELPTVIWNH